MWFFGLYIGTSQTNDSPHYAHLSSEHLAGYVDRLSTFRATASGVIATI